MVPLQLLEFNGEIIVVKLQEQLKRLMSMKRQTLYLVILFWTIKLWLRLEKRTLRKSLKNSLYWWLNPYRKKLMMLTRMGLCLGIHKLHVWSLWGLSFGLVQLSFRNGNIAQKMFTWLSIFYFQQLWALGLDYQIYLQSKKLKFQLTRFLR